MMIETGIILQLFILPVAVLAWQYFSQSISKTEWLFKTTGTFFFLLAAYHIFFWSGLSFYLRYSYFLIFLPGLIPSWFRAKDKPFWTRHKGREWINMVVATVLLIVSAVTLFVSIEAKGIPGKDIDLTFPLKNGTYYIAQGGSTSLMNGHMKVDRPELHEWRGQMWGLDILEIKAWGNRAEGLYPRNPEHYAIYGDSVYAPCNGRVVRTERGLPDLNPPNTDTVNKAGNYVLLRCAEDAYVLLAHLQQRSVVVKPGNYVTAGAYLGRVGNSGNTTEPHLHISAQKSIGKKTILDAEPRPMTFDDWFPIRNEDILVE